MKRLSLLLLIVLASCATPAISPSAIQPTPIVLSVYFSPEGGVTEAIVKELDNAKTSILVQAYSFTSAPIAKALVTAYPRGVKVQIILDKSHLTERYTNAPFLAKSGVLVRIDSAHAIAHNKIMIIDGEIVITGSFNFTKAAEEKNAENLLVIRDKTLAEEYLKKWQDHEKHSDPYVGR